MTFGCAGNLPDEDSGFIGRLGVLATVRRHLTEARLVTLTGLGGVGKTRTALRLAHERHGRHQDGVWFADVSAVTDPCLVRPMIEAALNTGSLSEWAGGRRGLLVLDGCERVAPVCAQVAGELLGAAPGLHVLVTSRVPLGLPDERVVALAPMETAGADNEAVRLFAARARSVQPGFELDELTVTSVAELCARLDGIPLAIELAALRLTSMTVNGVAAGLKDRFALLTGPADGRSLHDSLTRSYDLCEPAERLLWAQLSVFAGDFDLEAARFVCGEEIDGLVEALVDKSVLLIRTDYPGTRYKLLGTLAEYGATRLDDSRQIRHRHLLYYLGLATRSDQDWSGPRQMYWFERMRQEHDNVRVALEHALHTPDEAVLALRLLSSLWFMWVCCGFAGEGRRYLERALDANPEPSRERCKAMWVLSYVRSAQGDSMGAMSMAELCGEEARQIKDTKAVILSSKMQGTAALLQGELKQASELLEVAIEFIAESGELNPGLLPAVVEQSIVLTKQGALKEAESLLLECLLTCEERGELFVGSYAYWALADARLAMGRCQEALGDVRKALRLKRPFHDILGMLIALETAAGIYAALGQPTVSVRLLGALEENWKAAGLPMLGAPWLTDDHEALTRKCREALGENAYQKAFDSGMPLDLAEATALALGTRPAGELTELKIRVAGPAGTALTEAAVERVARAFGFTLLVEEGDGGTTYGLVPRDDGEGVPAEQRLEEMDRRLREDPPRAPSVARLVTVLRNTGPAVVLIERTLIVHAQGRITTRRLSSAEQAFLRSRPRLFDDPDGLVAEFRQLATESAVDASPQAGRDYDQGIAAELGVPVAVAIKGWGDPEGLEITLNTPVWTKRGYTDCNLAALLIKPLPGTSTPPRKVIAKVCPPGPLSREYSRHRLALEVSVPGFRDKHLVGLLPHPPYITDTGGYVYFQEPAGGSLTDMVQMAELTAPHELVPVFQRVIKGVMSEWNPYPPEVHADLDSEGYLRAELGARFCDGAKLHTWARECGLLEPERSWIWFSGDRSAKVLPNPLAMVAGTVVGRHHVQHLRGFSHGDLHHGNVLVPRAHTGELKPDLFRLIDLTTFEKAASLSRDPAELLLSLIAKQVPQPREALLDLIARGKGKDNLVAPLVRVLYHDKLVPLGFRDDWRHQLLLSLLAAALTHCTFADVDEHLKWWFFRLAARCGAAYLRSTASWDPPATAVPQQLRPEHMRGFEMRKR